MNELLNISRKLADTVKAANDAFRRNDFARNEIELKKGEELAKEFDRLYAEYESKINGKQKDLF